MRRNAAFAILSLLVSFLCSACAPAAPSDHPPEFLNDIGKTLIELKNEHAEKVMSECEDQLKCAGFLTTADILFPDMENDMSFEDFFSLIGVDDYEYLLGEEVRTGEGWLIFMYRDMEVMVNTNEITPGGGWNFTGEDVVKRNAPVSIADPEISNTNQDIADAVMLDESMS